MTIRPNNELSDAEKRLLFEWNNHITTSALVIIGGILGFVPKPNPPLYAVVAIFLVVIGAALALGVSSRMRPDSHPVRFGQIGRVIERQAHLLVAGGAAVFIFGFFQNLP